MSAIDEFWDEFSLIKTYNLTNGSNLSNLFGKENGERIHLYPYQIKFLRHIYTENCVCVVKARRAGYSSAYLLHALFRLYRTFLVDRAEYDKLNFIVVSCNKALSVHSEKFIRNGLRLFDNADFVLTALDHITFLTPGTLKTRLVGYKHRDVDEVFFDEYHFFPDNTDLSSLEYALNVKKVIGVTTMGNVKSTVQKYINKFSKNEPDVIFTPWYECPLYNKHLKWERLGIVVEEKSIDEEGNVEYDPDGWRRKIANFWEPKSDWSEKYEGLILSQETFDKEFNCKNGKRIFF
ncbi:MAG: DEAD/DEAH box helicase family protein [Bacteroidales bacterium]|nr:DEAD/DEAH box helicase family protein [Bacteroidales bacterium]